MSYLAPRQDAERSGTLTAEFDGILLDFSRQRATAETFQLLLALAEAAGLKSKIHAMAAGAHLNITEDRAVGHMALRAPAASSAIIDGVDVVPAVHSVLDRIHAFTASIRAGERKGVTGKALTDVVSIGIGGSYLGVEFVYEALRKESTASAACEGRRLRFLANVDPVDVARALEGLNPGEGGEDGSDYSLCTVSLKATAKSLPQLHAYTSLYPTTPPPPPSPRDHAGGGNL